MHDEGKESEFGNQIIADAIIDINGGYKEKNLTRIQVYEHMYNMTRIMYFDIMFNAPDCDYKMVNDMIIDMVKGFIYHIHDECSDKVKSMKSKNETP